MTLSPDELVFWQWGGFRLNATLIFTWLLMALLTLGAWSITHRLSTDAGCSRWQTILEVLVSGVSEQIDALTRTESSHYLPFIATLFIFILSANLLAVVPGFLPPTGSLSTTTALALCVFIAAPLYGISAQGARGYLRHYLHPTPLMLPFNLIGELSRTIALAVRLYGNIMSGTVIAGILLSLMPFFFPVLMQLLGLITGSIQAYIFAILATLYIASASAAGQRRSGQQASTAQQTSAGQHPDKEAACKT